MDRADFKMLLYGVRITSKHIFTHLSKLKLKK